MSLWKTYSTMPMWKRFIVASPIALLCFWAALSLQAYAWTQAVKFVIEEETGADIISKNSYFNLKGEVGVEDVRFTIADPSGEETTFEMDRVVVETPGFGWYVKNALLTQSEELPDHLAVRIENPRNVAADPNTPGNYTNLPYDAMGCVPEALTPSDLLAMNVPSKRHIRIALDKANPTDTVARFGLRTEGAGELEMQMQIELPRPIKMDYFADRLEQAPLKSVQLEFTDLGFIAKRNAKCAKKHSLTAAAFTDYHMQEVARFTGRQGTTMGQGTAAAYREFAEHGGKLTLRTAGTRKVSLARFVTMDRMQQMRMFPLMISANGKAPANFAFETGVPQPASDDAPVAAVPVNAVAPAPTLAPGTLPAANDIVAYAQLQALLGQHVDVTTTYGSVRKGVLTNAGPLQASVQLDKSEGGLLLHLPKDSITQIRYTPVAPPATQANQVN